MFKKWSLVILIAISLHVSLIFTLDDSKILRVNAQEDIIPFKYPNQKVETKQPVEKLLNEQVNEILKKEIQMPPYTFNKDVNLDEYEDYNFSGTLFWDEKVIYNNKPVILGVDDRTINIGQSFDGLEGISAFDEEDGNITDQIQMTGTVNTDKAGRYEITYRVIDSSEQITTAVRNVTVLSKAEAINQIPAIDASNRIIKVGESFNPLEGVMAYDPEEGDMTSKVEVTLNNVDNTTVGTYDVTYKVVDSQGAEAILTIMVMVREIPQTGYQLFIGQGIILLVGASLILYREKRQS